MRPFHALALTRPLFTEPEFTATTFDRAAAKAWFANALSRFIESDFRRTLSAQRLHSRLSNCYAHIAHVNRQGFAREFFEDLCGRVAFPEEALSHPWWGDPTSTYCDVERAIQARLHACDPIALYRARRTAEIDSTQQAQFARLRTKYDGVPVPSPDLPPEPPVTPMRRRKGMQATHQTSRF